MPHKPLEKCKRDQSRQEDGLPPIFACDKNQCRPHARQEIDKQTVNGLLCYCDIEDTAESSAGMMSHNGRIPSHRGEQ